MKKRITFLFLLISLVGCSSQTPFDMAKSGPTMKDNYENHMTGDSVTSTESQWASSVEAERHLENDVNYKSIDEYAYGRLQNPEMEMFVYPHRSTRQGVIVPGYVLRFPMYEKVQYGLVRDVPDVQ